MSELDPVFACPEAFACATALRIFTALGLALALVGCGQHASNSAANAPMTARDMAEDCGLFTDPFSKRMLDLDLPNRATLTVLSPAAKEGEDVVSSKNVIESKGTFSIDPGDTALVVSVNGTRTRYEAFSPEGIDECILLNGSPSDADLNASWFGSVTPPDDDHQTDQP